MNSQTPLENALVEVMLEEFADVPGEDEIEITASSLFHKKMKKIGKVSALSTVHGMRVSLKRAVAVAAIIVILTTTALAFPQVGQKFIHYLVENEGSHYQFFFDPEQAATAPKSIETAYYASYIPDGYTLCTSNVHPTAVFYYWQDESRENYIMFHQTVIGDVDKVPNSDHAEAVVLNINGYQVFRIRNETTLYCWTDNHYFYSLYFGPDVNEAYIYNIFEGIKPLESM